MEVNSKVFACSEEQPPAHRNEITPQQISNSTFPESIATCRFETHS